jgi:hypothetical protein
MTVVPMRAVAVDDRPLSLPGETTEIGYTKASKPSMTAPKCSRCGHPCAICEIDILATKKKARRRA